MTIFRILACAVMLSTAVGASADEVLAGKLRAACDGFGAEAGVAVIADGSDTTVVNGGLHCPMLSVFKLHEAITVARFAEERGLCLSDTLAVTCDMLNADTWSPLRDAHPRGGRFTIARLLEYSIGQSDNNACDILFGMIGGTEWADSCLRSMGLTDFAIRRDEGEMHEDIEACRDNWSTPLEAARLLDMLLSREIIDPANRDFILRTMIGCSTGRGRLAAPLAATGVTLGHKTGTSDRDALGRAIGTNDVGFVLLPDGRRYVIAVFVKDSHESDEANEALIADISRIVYEHYAGGEKTLHPKVKNILP